MNFFTSAASSSLVFRMFYRDSSSKIHSASPNPVVPGTSKHSQISRWKKDGHGPHGIRLKRMATMVGTSQTGKVLPWLKDFPMAQNDRVFLMVLTIQWNLVPVKMVPENLCDGSRAGAKLGWCWWGSEPRLACQPGVSIVMGAPQ